MDNWNGIIVVDISSINHCSSNQVLTCAVNLLYLFCEEKHSAIAAKWSLKIHMRVLCTLSSHLLTCERKEIIYTHTHTGLQARQRVNTVHFSVCVISHRQSADTLIWDSGWCKECSYCSGRGCVWESVHERQKKWLRCRNQKKKKKKQQEWEWEGENDIKKGKR